MSPTDQARPRPEAANDQMDTTPAVAAARLQLESCRASETLLVQALADVEAVVTTRSQMGVGIVGARNLPPAGGTAGGRMGPVDVLVAEGFQECGTNAIADLYILLASVRQAGHAAAVRLKRAESMAAFDRFDPVATVAGPSESCRHLRVELADLDPTDDPLLPADSEGGDL